MAYLIDESYFNVELNVPNTLEVNSGSLVELNYYIGHYTRLLLLNSLGYALFTELDSYIDVNGDLEVLAPQKWKDLVNGKEYTKNDITVKWKGLLYTEGGSNRSLLANYVYYEWLKNSISQVTGVGEVSLNAKNAIGVNSTQRLVNVWNDFLGMYQGHYTDSSYGYYPYFYSVNALQNITLNEFLQDNSTDFESPNLFRFEIQNQLGL